MTEMEAAKALVETLWEDREKLRTALKQINDNSHFDLNVYRGDEKKIRKIARKALKDISPLFRMDGKFVRLR